MLQSIRERSQGWFTWTIVIAVCISFALWGVHSYLYSNKWNDAVVTVNGTKITMQQLMKTYHQLKRQVGNVPQERSNQRIKAVALNSLISSLVLTQAAHHSGFRVGPSLIETTIAHIPLFQEQGLFSKARLRRAINNLSISLDEFVSELRSSLLVNQVKSGLTFTAFTLPHEEQKLNQIVHQTRRFQYAFVDHHVLTQEFKISQKEVFSYYQAHQEEFKTPEKVSIDYVVLSLDHLMKNIHPTEHDLEAFYHSTLSTYTQSQRWQIASVFVPCDTIASSQERREAQAKIKNIYASLKKSPHEVPDQTDGVQYTKSPWVSAASMNSQIRDVLAQLKTVGEVSQPIQIEHGYILIQVLGIKPAKVLSFDHVKEAVLQAYRQQHAEQQFSEVSDQLANLAYETPSSLKPAAKQLGLAIQTSPLFTKAGTTTGIAHQSQVINMAFSDDVLLQNNNSEPFNLTNNSMIILRVHQHQKAAVQPFRQLKASIITKLKQEHTQKRSQQIAEMIVKALHEGQSTTSLMKHYPLNWHSAEVSLSDRSTAIAPPLLEVVFNFSRASHPQATSVVLPDGQVAIVFLRGIKSTQTQASLSDLKPQMARVLGEIDYQLYKKHVLSSAKIKKPTQKAADQDDLD